MKTSKKLLLGASLLSFILGSWLVSVDAQNVAGGTLSGTTLAVTNTSNQAVFGTTNTTTLSFSAPGASRVVTFADPGGADSVAYLAASQALTNKTITAPVLDGTVTGTYTLGGTPTLASAAGVPYVGGVAAAYRLARGTITLDGSNPSSAATGLTTVVACNVDGPAAAGVPGDDPMGASPFINSTSIDIYAWGTNGTDPTPVPSTNNSAVFYWICIGT